MVVMTWKMYSFVPLQRDRFLRHSDTGPSHVSDWPSQEPSALPTATPAGTTGSFSSARPRAWSVRTFQDFLPPLPQLHKKWCSWNSTSPFTKLVDSVSNREKLSCIILYLWDVHDGQKHGDHLPTIVSVCHVPSRKFQHGATTDLTCCSTILRYSIRDLENLEVNTLKSALCSLNYSQEVCVN